MPKQIQCTACETQFSISNQLFEQHFANRVTVVKCRRCGEHIQVDSRTVPKPVIPEGFSIPRPADVAPAGKAVTARLSASPTGGSVAAKASQAGPSNNPGPSNNALANLQQGGGPRDKLRLPDVARSASLAPADDDKDESRQPQPLRLGDSLQSGRQASQPSLEKALAKKSRELSAGPNQSPPGVVPMTQAAKEEPAAPKRPPSKEEDGHERNESPQPVGVARAKRSPKTILGLAPEKPRISDAPPPDAPGASPLPFSDADVGQVNQQLEAISDNPLQTAANTIAVLPSINVGIAAETGPPAGDQAEAFAPEPTVSAVADTDPGAPPVSGDDPTIEVAEASIDLSTDFDETGAFSGDQEARISAPPGDSGPRDAPERPETLRPQAGGTTLVSRASAASENDARERSEPDIRVVPAPAVLAPEHRDTSEAVEPGPRPKSKGPLLGLLLVAAIGGSVFWSQTRGPLSSTSPGAGQPAVISTPPAPPDLGATPPAPSAAPTSPESKAPARPVSSAPNSTAESAPLPEAPSTAGGPTPPPPAPVATQPAIEGASTAPIKPVGFQHIPAQANASRVTYLVKMAIRKARQCHLGGRVAGTAEVFFTFSSDGKVAESRIDGEPIASAPVAACIHREVRSIQIGSFDGAPFTVSETLVLK